MASFEVENNDNNKKRKNKNVEKSKKKKKLQEVVEVNENLETEDVLKIKIPDPEKVKVIDNSIDTLKTTEISDKVKPSKARQLPTVTIAVPGSILDNAQSPEFRTYLAGQIARAACIYKIDEVRFSLFLLSHYLTFSYSIFRS